jgi:hypothetical protein
VQVAALVAGHVAGLVLAHDRGLLIYADHRDATRSQYWMLTVMVAFTCLGLWLLSARGGVIGVRRTRATGTPSCSTWRRSCSWGAGWGSRTCAPAARRARARTPGADS